MDVQAVHIDTLDPRISIAYRQRAYVGDKIFPFVSVKKLSGKYAKYSKQAFRAAASDALDEKGYPKYYTLDLEPYQMFSCGAHGVGTTLTDATREDADNPAEIDLIHREFVQGLIALARELEVKALINTTNITQNTTPSGTSLWSNVSAGANTADVIAEIMTRSETILKSVPGSTLQDLKLLLPRPVYRVVRTNTIVRDYVKSFYRWNASKPIDAQELAAALEIGEVIVVDNVQLTSAEGATDALDFIWPSAAGASVALLYYSTGRPSPLTPNFGYIFRSTIGFRPLKEVYDQDGELTKISSRENRDTVLVEPNAGFLWNNPI